MWCSLQYLRSDYDPLLHQYNLQCNKWCIYKINKIIRFSSSSFYFLALLSLTMTLRIFSSEACLGPKVYSEVPDGGWGWIVAVAFFLVEVFSYGVIKSFGIFLNDLMSEFNESNSRVSWIISICVFVMTFTGKNVYILKHWQTQLWRKHYSVDLF